MIRTKKNWFLLCFALIVQCAFADNGNTYDWVTGAVNADNVNYGVFFSDSVGDQVSYHIYVPQEYHNNPDKRYPVLYWLHGGSCGLPGVPVLSGFFNNAIVHGKIPAMLVVFPNGLPMRMWCNSKDGATPVESMLIDDLLVHIDSNYRTISSTGGRIIEGWSMGGYGAARMGFKHYDKFAAFSLFGAGPLQLDFTVGPVSGAVRKEVFESVYGGDWDYFEAKSPWRLAEQFVQSQPHNIFFRQVIGTEDATLVFNRQFHQHLIQLGLDYEYIEVEGVSHSTMPVLYALGESNWDFYNSAFDKNFIFCSKIDFNGDGIIDLLDLLIIAENWLQCSQSLEADISQSGTINLVDMAVFSSFWNRSCLECEKVVILPWNTKD